MKLREIRAKYKLNQSEIAKITGLSQKSISNYENAQTYPNVEALIKLADYFHISIDELIGHEVKNIIDKSLMSDEDIAIIEELKNLNTIQKIKILAYIDGLKAGKEKQQAIITNINEVY